MKRWIEARLQKLWPLTKEALRLVVLVTAFSMLWQQAEAQDERALVQSSEQAKPVITLLAAHRGEVFNAAFSPDGTRIVTANGDATASVWDGHTGQRLMQLEGHTYTVIKAVFSPDGSRIVIASADRTARLWDAKTGNVLQLLAGPATQPNNPPFTQEIHTAAFSADGTRIVTVSNYAVQLWRVPLPDNPLR